MTLYAGVGSGANKVKLEQPSLQLTTGDLMPAIGFGCWKLPKETTAECVFNAIKCGYRMIDEACDYGNEREAGLGIKMTLD
jgi:D-xylose reductase